MTTAAHPRDAGPTRAPFLEYTQAQVSGGEPTRFVGLANYADLFGDSRFWTVLAATVWVFLFDADFGPVNKLLGLSDFSWTYGRYSAFLLVLSAFKPAGEVQSNEPRPWT